MSKQVIGKVKNRLPAPIQITAEQILSEAQNRQDDGLKEPKQHIADAEELAMHKLSKRKEFEDSIRRQRMHIGTWVKYAQWEATHHDFERARSVFERALDVDEYNTNVWFAYADMEMRNEFINHARNVWDRAVALLPRVDQLWYKYTYMEDMIGNVTGCRGVFERWMRCVGLSVVHSCGRSLFCASAFSRTARTLCSPRSQQFAHSLVDTKNIRLHHHQQHPPPPSSAPPIIISSSSSILIVVVMFCAARLLFCWVRAGGSPTRRRGRRTSTLRSGATSWSWRAKCTWCLWSPVAL